jgi:hypothetical protein
VWTRWSWKGGGQQQRNVERQTIPWPTKKHYMVQNTLHRTMKIGKHEPY